MSPAHKVLAVVLAAGALAAWSYSAGVGREHDRGTAALQTLRTEHAEVLRNIAGLTLKSVQAARNTEQRWAQAQEASARVTQTQTAAAERARDSARAAADRMQQRVDSLVAAARRSAADPGTAAAIASAGDPIGVLADVLGRADRRAGILADYADRARIAGASCERDYDTLTASTSD